MATRKHSSTRKNFDDFVRGYVTAALWSSNDNADESGGEPLDTNYSEDDIAPSSYKAMKRDCAKFWKANKRALEMFAKHRRHQAHEGSAYAHVGHDFWLSANGHGTGFWDRDAWEKDDQAAFDKIGKLLHEASRKFASDMYVGDDGKIYVSPER
jgi:hypothetical protein